jgi:hypothetical protein
MEDSLVVSSVHDSTKQAVEVPKTQDTSIESSKSVVSNHYMSHDQISLVKPAEGVSS